MLIIALAGCGGSPLLSLPLSHKGQFVIDADVRVRIFHGVNMVAKIPPYEPSALGFGDQDGQLLSAAGINLVRLGVIYAGVEPMPGSYDDRYLDSIAATVEMLAVHGVLSLLDFHQDMFAPIFTGEGFPDWGVQDDGLPVVPNYGFPNDYFEMAALQHAYDHFWEDSPGPDGEGLQEHYNAAWQHVAQRFKDNPAVLGYDVFNEPFPGSDWRLCYLPSNPPSQGCPQLDHAPLSVFMAKVTKAIEAVDSNHMIFYEPWIFFGGGVPTFMPSPGGAQVGMSFHDYDPPDFTVPIQHALNQLQATGDAMLMTEFGSSVTPAPVVQVANLTDASMLSWCYWTYAANTLTPDLPDQAIIVDLSKPRTGSNVNQAVLNAISRPYPQVVAGTPRSFSFDPGTGTFQLVYSTSGLTSSLRNFETDVAVPVAQYPNGYVARISGGSVISLPNATLLRIVPTPGSMDTVSVTIQPRRNLDDLYKNASGLTGEEVPRSSTSGARTKRNSWRPWLAQACARASRSALSIRCTPIATIATAWIGKGVSL